MAEIKVTAQILKQGDNTLYAFVMNSLILKKLCYALPRTTDNPDEIQRIRSEPRCKEIGEYVQKQDSVLPHSIVVNLNEHVSITPTAEPRTVTVTFPKD